MKDRARSSLRSARSLACLCRSLRNIWYSNFSVIPMKTRRVECLLRYSFLGYLTAIKSKIYHANRIAYYLKCTLSAWQGLVSFLIIVFIERARA